MTIKTKRLILRPWQEADLEPFAALNADPRVIVILLPFYRHKELRREKIVNLKGKRLWKSKENMIVNLK